MTKVISFISRKGGTGKTTNAINLSTMLVNLGHRLVLVETDTNYTLSTLRQMETHRTGAKDDRMFQILGSEDDKVIEELKSLRSADNFDIVIVDSAGKTTDTAIRRLTIESDLVIVPTSLTQNDLLVTYQTIEDLKAAKEHNPDLIISVLPNRIHSSMKTSTIREALSELDAFILENSIPQKNLFANFSTILPEKQYLDTAKEILQLLDL
ncbi:MAG TPA: plasmid partitioning protein [Cytophagales bacterium]|nr:plasmid partitioning protein [Cytophagales bacterium]HAA21253.1 plasmid partitioning protein [Cytophagales bacterium]HAP62441.1 plasmid partitioning protein [Cytophagales bacterium]